jgi:DNA-binding NarL/FixJ family response regulator
MNTMTAHGKSETSARSSRNASRESKPAPNERLIRLLLVDDHEVVRLGLRALFNRTATIQVVGEAGTMESAVAEAIRLKPDVILMDVRLPDGDGIEACRDIHSSCPDIRVLFLTSFSDEAAVLSTVFAGAAGFLLKEIGGDALVRAVESVAKGQSIFDSSAVQRMIDQIQPHAADAQPSPDDALSARDERILSLVAEGKTNKEIAAELGLSDKTIKNLLSVIFQKLQISRRSKAAALFVKRATAHGYPAVPKKDK